MGKEKIRIFINGFGRIGRCAARIILEDDTLELVGINDLYSYDQMAYLLKYDSIYRSLHHTVLLEGNKLCIDTKEVILFNESHPNHLDLKPLEIDVLLECTGMFLTEAFNKPYIEKGVKKVIVSTPSKDSMPTFIYGANHKKYAQETIISNSSCSANAIVPIFQIIDKHFGIQGAGISMYHSYTNYQNLLDSAHHSKDIRRTRSATQNIIPLESTAAEATYRFFPHLENKLAAKSIRIPIPSTTLYDFSIHLKKKSFKDDINRILEQEVLLSYNEILDTVYVAEDSASYIQSPYSAIIVLPLTKVVQGDLLRISAWQDNEYGYVRRLIDMVKVVSCSDLCFDTSQFFEERILL